MRPTALLPLLAGVCLSAQQPGPPAPAASGQPPMTFEVAVNYVETDATVTDAQGNPAAGLTRDDILPAEDDRPQTVTVFSHVTLPVDRPDAPLSRATPIEPDVRRNRREFGGRVLFSRTDQQNSTASRSPGDGFGHVATIPLKDVAPRRYVLKVEARSTTGAVAARELEFTRR